MDNKGISKEIDLSSIRNHKPTKDILCTLGPASMNRRVITRLDGLGIKMFRINLSHNLLSELEDTIRFIQGLTSVPICLDTEGAQIRTGGLISGEVIVKDNSIVTIHKCLVPGDMLNFNLYPANITGELKAGDIVSIDCNSVLLQVVEEGLETVKARVLIGGVIGQRKAVNLDRDIDMPSLTEKDKEALLIGIKCGVRYMGLSFANRGSDVDDIRAIIGKKAFLISKIESLNGIANFDDIAAKSDAILLDRGDMSRQMPVEKLPILQKQLIKKSKEMGVKIYVATNLLESMVTNLNPSRSEVNDVFNTLEDGADGLVLAAETAIGSYPLKCVSMIVKLIREFEEKDQNDKFHYSASPFSLLNNPHGGLLVNRLAKSTDLNDIEKLKSLVVRDADLFDCEHIGHGAYSPIAGFMDKETLESVLNSNCLKDGLAWTMPIVLQVKKESIRELGVDERVALKSSKGDIHVLLDIKETYEVDLENVAKKWYGTTSMDHPGVVRLFSNGDRFVAGDIMLVKRLPSYYQHYELTPAQTRNVFTQKGWNKVVGFHSRNVIHRVHEYIQLSALELTHADGLYVSPIIGPKKKGDFLAYPIMKSYQTMLDFNLYPAGKVVVGSFSTYARYGGPREAVLTALRHKNMGCSHFIIGRDHTGVGDFYKSIDYRSYFEKLGDIGIEPVFFDAVGYNPKSKKYEKLSTAGTLEPISGTKMRENFQKNISLPDWFMREIIQDTIREEIANKKPIFY